MRRAESKTSCLLVPVEVDDRTGYRRYGLRQLPRARALAALRDVGMPLEDVAAIVDTTDRGVRRARLVEHRRCLIDAARRAAGRVDAMDRMIEREDAMTSSLRIRAYITGVTKTSLWFNYAAGARNVAGNRLADGLRKNERLEAPILTPTTKFELHDRSLGRDDAMAEGLVTADLFDRCADVCFRLFARGTELAAQRGLILVDTKYELGLLGDEIVLMDEVHTPDSSRYWYADTYDELFRKNKDQRALDKEPLREWMVERGFRGDGEAPVMTDEVRIATATRYILLAEELTQRSFEASELTAAERVANVLRD
jgi:phosphoribosylaminoimidazole-succinocarboxamide synthase